MTTATVVSAYQDGTYAYLAVSVAGDGPGGSAREYQGSTPLLDAQGAQKPNAQLKGELVAACKAQRDATLRPAQAPVAISGSVTL